MESCYVQTHLFLFHILIKKGGEKVSKNKNSSSRKDEEKVSNNEHSSLRKIKQK